MFSSGGPTFKKRFRNRVVLPAAVILVATALMGAGALIVAGRGTDAMAVMGQQAEVWRAVSTNLDNLAIAQESVGLCEQCIAQASTENPDAAWLNDNIGSRMFDLFDVQETYILNADDQPVYASVGGEQASPAGYESIAPAVSRFVQLARGEAKRPTGKSNLNERLPGAPPEPLVLPPMPGFFDEPMTLHPSVRTSPDIVHATDLVRIGDRVALVSAMQMARVGDGQTGEAEPAPMLVSLRYIDETLLSQISQQNFLANARLAVSPETREGEATTPLTDSEMRPLANLFWQPQLMGSAMIKTLAIPALGMFAVIAFLIVFMALKLRRMMRQDEEHVRKLHQAHAELKAKEAQAHHLAYHDVLTGLPNRAMFNDNADQAAIRARHGEPCAILLLDLDRFKNVNDRFGHLAGDALIKEVGERLSKVVGIRDAVARLGGDEFAVLLEGEMLAGGLDRILDRVLEVMRRPFEIVGSQAHVGVSIGVAMAPDHGTDRTELMRKADIALYRAKEEGRDCYRFFTDDMDETVQMRATLEAELRTALASRDGSLTVHYQPLVDSAGKKVIGLEALLRWKHAERGQIAPALFVPVAEETGLIGELGDLVLQDACEVACRWPQLKIAINLSPVQFCDETFAERLCTTVREAGVSASQFELEVTEGVVLDQNDSVRGALRRLRHEGFRIALDDFGTGYSSLSYLRDFEVDKIKIDKSFVQNLGHAVDAGAIVTAVVTLGHAMGLRVTAEGVETEDQDAFLRSAGCCELQGFYFSRAVPAHELELSIDEFGRRAA